MSDKELEYREKVFFETNVEGYWTNYSELVCEEDLYCSDTLFIIS